MQNSRNRRIFACINLIFLSLETNLSKVCRHNLKSMHSKARETNYANTNVKRFPVPDDKVSWNEPFPEYNPVIYTSQHILSGPEYADPDISTNPENGVLKFNQLDDGYNVDRTSYTGKYEVVNGLPRVGIS
ncbi:ADP-ribose pyrophosphatase, mitochondrial [Exaiptasia diaphana]|nr:ADP-ribose pyrophosphatase, mitochondrial [Exaiptasia diaphana]